MATTVDGSTGVSQIQDDKVTVAKLDLISTGSVPSLEAKGTSGVTSGYLKLNCSENSHGIKLLGPPHSAAADYTLTFPNNDGDADQFLQTNGSGVMSWAAAGGGVTHLGTMTTTSGTSQTITGLDFTDLNLLIFVVAQVSHSDGTSRKLSIGVAGGANLAIGDAVAAGNCSIGVYTLDLRANTGYFPQSPGNAPITSGSDFVGGGTGQARYLIGTNLRASSSTSVTVAFEGGVTFDNGKVEVYGLN